MATVRVPASQTNSTNAPSNVRFDPSYMKTLPGIMKIAEAICGLSGFICMQSIFYASYISAGGWYNFVSMAGFCVSLLFVLCYIFHIVEKLTWIPWLFIETGFAAIWCAFSFIAACIATSFGILDAGWVAAAVFGFIAAVIYGYEAFRKYVNWKAGKAPQGEKRTSVSHV